MIVSVYNLLFFLVARPRTVGDSLNLHCKPDLVIEAISSDEARPTVISWWINRQIKWITINEVVITFIIVNTRH